MLLLLLYLLLFVNSSQTRGHLGRGNSNRGSGSIRMIDVDRTSPGRVVLSEVKNGLSKQALDSKPVSSIPLLHLSSSQTLKFSCHDSKPEIFNAIKSLYLFLSRVSLQVYHSQAQRQKDRINYKALGTTVTLKHSQTSPFWEAKDTRDLLPGCRPVCSSVLRKHS